MNVPVGLITPHVVSVDISKERILLLIGMNSTDAFECV